MLMLYVQTEGGLLADSIITITSPISIIITITITSAHKEMRKSSERYKHTQSELSGRYNLFLVICPVRVHIASVTFCQLNVGRIR